MKILVFSQLYSPETATITDVCRDLTKRVTKLRNDWFTKCSGGNIFEVMVILKAQREFRWC